VFTRIIVPLCKPSLATVAIFCFLWSYNDLFTQLIMIRRRTKYPICALLNEISSKYGTDYGLMAASIAIIIIPVLIVYIFLQKNIIKGLTAGAIKG
jgi:raffinose/stachyose/melibiose transport system permease protein